MSNLAACTLTPQSPQCPGHACQVNGSRDGFPPGDKFEGFGHSAKDKPERENPDVNIPPSAHEPFTNRSNALSSSMSLPIVKLTLPLANRRCLQPRVTEARPKARGSWPET